MNSEIDSPKPFSIAPWKATAFIRLFGIFKVPLIWYVRPKVIELNEQRVVIKIRLRHRTKNHLNSMYFGTLAIGADIAGGMLAIMMLREMGADVSFVFKDIKGGDIIVSLGGQKIENIYDYTAVLGVLKIGEPVEIEVLRGSDSLKFSVTPGSRG